MTEEEETARYRQKVAVSRPVGRSASHSSHAVTRDQTRRVHQSGAIDVLPIRSNWVVAAMLSCVWWFACECVERVAGRAKSGSASGRVQRGARGVVCVRTSAVVAVCLSACSAVLRAMCLVTRVYPVSMVRLGGCGRQLSWPTSPSPSGALALGLALLGDCAREAVLPRLRHATQTDGRRNRRRKGRESGKGEKKRKERTLWLVKLIDVACILELPLSKATFDRANQTLPRKRAHSLFLARCTSVRLE